MNITHTNFRIVADSSADLLTRDTVSFAVAPLKIITAEKEFRDDAELHIADMVAYLKSYKGKSSSSCPNAAEWLNTFGDAQYVFCVTITSGMSGSYNAALVAKQLYEEANPNRRVHVIDSLSAGPGEAILVEKLEELIMSGKDFDSICAEISAYQQRTHLLFILQSLTNFANNGRVSPTTAKLAGVLNICVVGKASQQGTLQPLFKCRGMRKSTEMLITQLKQNGYTGGKVRITHCFNEEDATALKAAILSLFPSADIQIQPTRGLCSFYAEKGGLLVAYEQ